MQKQPPEVFYKKAVVKKIAIFVDKYLLESLFNSEYYEIYFEEPPILKNICERLLLKMCCVHETEKKQKLFIRNFNLILKNQVKMFCFYLRNKWKCLFLFHDWFPLELVFRYSILNRVLLNRAPTSTQLHPRPPSSFQPPPSSI